MLFDPWALGHDRRGRWGLSRGLAGSRPRFGWRRLISGGAWWRGRPFLRERGAVPGRVKLWVLAMLASEVGLRVAPVPPHRRIRQGLRAAAGVVAGRDGGTGALIEHRNMDRGRARCLLWRGVGDAALSFAGLTLAAGAGGSRLGSGGFGWWGEGWTQGGCVAARDTGRGRGAAGDGFRAGLGSPSLFRFASLAGRHAAVLAPPGCYRGAVLGGVKLWVLAMLAARKWGGCAWLRAAARFP